LLLAFASTEILDSESRGTHDNILLPDGSGSHANLLKSLPLSLAQLKVSLRLAVYRKLLGLGPKPLETDDQNFSFATESAWPRKHVHRAVS
jgi:hypothetical protein